MTFASRISALKPITIAAAITLIGVPIGIYAAQLQNQENPYPYPYLQLAKQTNTQAEIDREVSFYQQRVRERPQDGLERAALAEAYLKLARASGDTRWYLLAEQAAQESLAKLPFSNDGATLILARVAEAKHDFQTAIRLSQQVLQEHPHNSEARSLLITSYLAQGNVAEAGQLSSQLVTESPGMGSYLLQMLVDIATGQDAETLKHFQAAIAVEEPGELGSSARIRTALAQFYAERGQLNQAKQLYQETLKILPQYPPALIGLAKANARQGQYQAAERHYQEILSYVDLANVFDHTALVGLAEVAALQGDDAKAERLWQQSETFLHGHQDLSSFGHRRELAQLLLARGKEKDVAEAVRLMQTELQIRRDADTLDTMAWAYTRAGRWQDAREIMQAALKQGRRSAKFYYRAALIEQQSGQTKAAQGYLETAEAIDPTLTSAQLKLLGISQ
jgi:tetratricopeptide (TPR) repeat protein